MDKSNNKRRILALIEILRKNTNENKRLKLDQISYELSKRSIEVNNRKTLYDDFKILNEFGFNVEYDDGYYLLEAPFNLSEVKIIIDSVNSLKNLDNKFLDNLNSKLYQYVSYDEEKLLNELRHNVKHNDAKLLQHMEDVLTAISNSLSIEVLTKYKNEPQEIYPVFLHRENDYYYFYYHYPNSDKLYHYRFDTIKNIKLLDNKDAISITKKKIIDTILESSKAYTKGDTSLINIELVKNDEKLVSRFLDDFPTAIRTKDGFSIKANVNDVLFSLLVNYGSNIKIKDKEIAKEYINYLKQIIKNY